jgi:hypothetical protein
MATHTPGPWHVSSQGTRWPTYVEGPGGQVAACEEPEDATLIAAATDLLAACKAQHDAIDRLFAMLIQITRTSRDVEPFFPSKSGQPWEAMQAGHAAIAKATGESG